MLLNEGTVTWSSGINLNPDTANGGVGSIVNTSEATWVATGNDVMTGTPSDDGTPTFDNAGTFVKTGGIGGGGNTSINVQFNNTGTLDVQSGIVRLGGGSTHTGATLLSSGNGTIEFGNGVHTLDAATTLTAVNVGFVFGSTVPGTTTIGGVYDVSGTTTLRR